MQGLTYTWEKALDHSGWPKLGAFLSINTTHKDGEADSSGAKDNGIGKGGDGEDQRSLQSLS